VTARPPLDAIVFDAGGTLVRLDFEWMCDHLATLGVPLRPEALRRAEVEGRRRYDASGATPMGDDGVHPPLGTAGSTRAYFAGMLEAAGVDAARIEAALAGWFARHASHGLWDRPMEGARGALDALARAGYALAAVSNSDGRAERHLADHGVRDGLAFVVDSQHVGLEKPDPAIFHLALARLGVRPERALYVGDIRSVDERGAAAAGMHFVLVDPYFDYGPAGGPAIPSLDALPEHVARRFTPGRGTGVPAEEVRR
jgi:putative hydrolase of the HAD superfamily